jgi:GGDEF domain-containing protein
VRSEVELQGQALILVAGSDADARGTIRAALESMGIEVLREPFTIDRSELLVGASIGITVYPTDGDDIISLLRKDTDESAAALAAVARG